MWPKILCAVRLAWRICALHPECCKSHSRVTHYDLIELEKRMAKTQSELAADLRLVLEQQKKTSGEIVVVKASVTTLKEKIQELEDLITEGGVITQELADVGAAIKAQSQLIDDQLPDVVVVDPNPPAVDPATTPAA